MAFLQFLFPIKHISLFCFFCLMLVLFPELSYSVSLANKYITTDRKPPSCRSDQSLALLQFKSSFHLDRHSKLWSWKANTDCCTSWDGVTCDDFGFVIGLDVSDGWLVGNIDSNNSLFDLCHLQKVDLSGNDFNSSSIPAAGFARLNRSLTHLDLSGSRFSGEAPSEMFTSGTTSPLNFSSLSYLDLSYNNISHIPQQMFHLPSLKFLDLSGNFDLTGSLPEFPQESALQQLSLTNTKFSGLIPHSFGNLKKLIFLDLYRNNFEGEVPSSFSNLPHLEKLDMSHNRFVGPLPSLNASCMTITWIDLSSNKFSGPIPSSYDNKSLPNLIFLDLSNNELNGTIPSSLFTLPSLEIINLGENKFVGILVDEEFPNSFSLQLKYLVLNDNLLQGHIPSFISKLLSLEELDLSSNSFHGVVDPRMFASLKNLTTIDLSRNIMLSIDTSDIGTTIPSLSSFNFSSCNLFEVPTFLRYQPVSSLHLDLSNNYLKGKIPGWLGNKVKDLSLSQNSLDGFEDPFFNNFSSNLNSLDLSSNNFEGSLPIFPKYLDSILLSKNKFTGAIPLTICNTSWHYLDLSHNQISGEIPPCLFNRTMFETTVALINLGKNKLQGEIPDSFDTHCLLQGLNLNGNQLEGQLPRSLAKCQFLRVLDLGNNRINDAFPFWLEHLESLQILMLQSNRFHGPIRRQHQRASSSFTSLHIVGLSNNSFTGHLPLEYFSSSYLEGQGEDDDRQTSHSSSTIYYSFPFLMFPNKGQALEYTDDQMQQLSAIDLSNNLFDGEIPTTIDRFRTLMVLNLSHNNLVGKIPSSLANLTKLQLLDLSNNDLVGEIPPELTGLTFLSMFNVSRNHLMGMIPSGGQFFSFPSSSFEGNSRLCGIQLQIDCNPNKSVNAIPSSHENQLDGTNFVWMFVVAGCASGLIVGVVVEHFLLWRNRYYLEKVMNTAKFFQRKRPLRIRSLRRN